MKNVLKKVSLLLSFSLVIFVISCGGEDGPKIGGDGGSFVVADGVYIAGVSGEDTTIVVGYKLKLTKVEADGFGTQARDGFYQGYMFLPAGNYVFGEVADQELTAVYGGSASAYDDGESGNTDEYNGGYTVVDLSTSTTSTFNVASAGMHLVTFDSDTDEALLVPMVDWGVIGGGVFESACVSNGFNSDLDIDETSSSAEAGAVYTATGITLKNGEYKFRMNDNWKIDRRSSKASYDAANGYVVLTNLGGSSISSLEEGAGNIPVSGTSNGVYTITFTINATGQISVALTKTGEAEACAFDPATYTWGIIGGGTQGTEATDGWNNDKKLIYINGDGGVHKWRGVFPLDGTADNNMFKFRTNDTWATKLLPTTATVTNNTAEGTLSDDGLTNSDGQWFIADGRSGFFYVVISTADQGTTWNITFDEAEFQLIGEGSPVAGWDSANGQAMSYNDDLASWTGEGSFLTTGWKFIINNSFDYNLGGTLDGTTALEFNNSVATVSSADFYEVVLTTNDGGVTYTATAFVSTPPTRK